VSPATPWAVGIAILLLNAVAQRRAFIGPPGEDIRDVNFSPDRKWLASPSYNGLMRLWDVATRRELCAWTPHPSGLYGYWFSRDGRRLLTTGYDTMLVLWDVAELTKETKRPPPPKVMAADLEKWWTAQAGDDAERAFDAVHALAAVPEKALPFLKDRLHAVPHLDAKLVQRWIDELDCDNYAVREKSSKALGKLGELAGPALRANLAGPLTPEVRRRIEVLITKLEEGPYPSETLRALCTVEVLEIIATQEAVHLLESLAAGAPEARLTVEARFSLLRLRS
jgi:hypothetical protein